MRRRAIIHAVIFMATGVVTLVAIIGLWQRTVERWSSFDEAESQDYEMLIRIERFSHTLDKMQAAKRGYILTGSDTQLDGHNAAVKVVTNGLNKLVRWQNQFPKEQTSLRAVQSLLSERLANYKLSLEDYRNHGFVADTQAKFVEKGTILQERLEQAINQMVTGGTGRLRARTLQKEAQMRRIMWQTSGLLAVSMLAFLLASWFLMQEVEARREAERSVRKEHEELEKALAELKQSHWHLDKVAEVLPVCMECGKVKTGDARWETIAKYFHDNDLLLSHGYCPNCSETAIAKIRRANPPRPT